MRSKRLCLSDYFVKKRLGKNPYDIEKYFKLIVETSVGIIIPRGFVSTRIQFCKFENIPIKIIDELSRQEDIIVAPPNSGKTVIGLELIAR